MNFARLAENTGLEEDEFLELVELFVKTSASDVEALQSAIDEEDIQQAIEAAHFIKGAAGNLGFMELYEAAKDIEEKARVNSLEGATEAARTIKEKYDQIAEALGTK
jgi:HPt (histidine-containing phosphotransfer) domain-containing protein